MKRAGECTVLGVLEIEGGGKENVEKVYTGRLGTERTG